MHIFLIRHGESIANNGNNYVKRIPDHLVTLSDTGKHQAHEAGKTGQAGPILKTFG